jgi:hypothetical protein
MSFGTDTLDSHWTFFQPKVMVRYIPYANVTDDNPTAGTVEDIEALIEEPTKEDYEYGQSQGVHQQLRTWNLRLSLLLGVIVTKNGKIVEDDGTVWVIIRTVKRSLGTRWNCLCYALEG